ncbi:MAG: hypothetical protein ACOC3V_05765 [bacterium]
MNDSNSITESVKIKLLTRLIKNKLTLFENIDYLEWHIIRAMKNDNIIKVETDAIFDKVKTASIVRENISDELYAKIAKELLKGE